MKEILNKLHYGRDRFVFVLFIFVAFVIFLVTNLNFTSRSAKQVEDRAQRVFVERSGTIPKIIHFIWNNETLPSEFVSNIQSFLKNNPQPDWDYYFWTKDSGLKFVKDKYPFLYPRLSNDKVTSNFFRADTLRYLVIHEYGGLYFDLDTVSVKPLDVYVHTHECSLAAEPGEHYFLWNVDLLISNGALLCVPQHPFYKLIMLKIWEHPDACKDAFTCTGPNFITRLYRKINQTSGMVSRLPDLQPSETFQDVYDSKMNDGLLRDKCSNTTKLHPNKVAICEKWKARGMKERKLSENALTFHTWYHTNVYKVTYSDDNIISKLIPCVKIYGRNLW